MTLNKMCHLFFYFEHYSPAIFANKAKERGLIPEVKIVNMVDYSPA